MPKSNQLKNLHKDLIALNDPLKKELLSAYFKTGKGQYAEGDEFAGVMVGDSRKIAKKYKDLPLNQIQELLHSKFHEERLIALLILVNNFKKSDSDKKDKIFNFYLNNTKYINNWDLVDLSASRIVGEYLKDKKVVVLYKLANSQNLWERRIAIIATSALIWNKNFTETFKIAKILINDPHDLIHKAVGWMLREVGKRDRKTEEKFLKKHYQKMPRTMLRYAIEKFPAKLRLQYLTGKVKN